MTSRAVGGPTGAAPSGSGRPAGMPEVLGEALSGERWAEKTETARKLWLLIAGVCGVDPGDPDER